VEATDDLHVRDLARLERRGPPEALVDLNREDAFGRLWKPVQHPLDRTPRNVSG
jgi:hypothetical protein